MRKYWRSGLLSLKLIRDSPEHHSDRRASGAKTRQEWDTFLAGPASEIRFPLDQVKNAINHWTLTANTNYRKGLAALYEDNVGQAADYFREATKQAPPGDLYVTVVSAYTEYRQGKLRRIGAPVKPNLIRRTR